MKYEFIRLKHWIKNTVDETIAENAVTILESNKEGLEKIETAKNLLKLGIEVDKVVQGTGLTEEVVKELIKELRL